MTANDAATLLRTYGDALEAEYPVPADQTAPKAPEQRHLGWLVAATLGLAAAIALLVGYGLLRDDSDVRTADIPDGAASIYVFPGETVLQEDPLIVTVASAVEPTFDTSELGERFQLTPIMSLDDPGVRAFVDGLADGTNRDGTPSWKTTKITLLGRDGDDPAAIVITDTDRGIDGEIDGTGLSGEVIQRTRFSRGAGGGSGVANDVPPGDELFKLQTPETLADFIEVNGGFGFGSDRIAGSAEPTRSLIQIDVSLDVAVLQYVTDQSISVWTVPVGGVAAIPTWLNEDSVVEVFLYSASGEQIYPRRPS